MNIAMFTNTYLPHVGGVARSVHAFTQTYRRRGHRVLVVAPRFANQPQVEHDVVRVPAIQNFNGSDFSVVLPIAGVLGEAIDTFGADIVHSHHPFLLGNSALRVARQRDLPLVFTHHTLYEHYTHYVPADSLALKRFAIELATHYANACDRVFAPSASIADLLRARGVTAPVDVLPTGVDFARFSAGDGARARAAWGLPADGFVVGHAGRLAAEKNLEYLAAASAAFLAATPDAHFLLVGGGPAEGAVVRIFHDYGVAARVHRTGVLQPEVLADAYAAMDVFAFASMSETQGMVLTEALAAGTPVVALDAPGVREVVRDGHNGRLLERATAPAGFADALRELYARPAAAREALARAARATARELSLERCAERALGTYGELLESGQIRDKDAGTLHRIANLIAAEWDLLSSGARALGAAANAGEAVAPGEDER